MQKSKFQPGEEVQIEIPAIICAVRISKDGIFEYGIDYPYDWNTYWFKEEHIFPLPKPEDFKHV